MTTWDEANGMWCATYAPGTRRERVRWWSSWHRAVRWLNEQDAAERYIQDGDWDVQP